MALLKSDLLRSFVIGFAIGAVGLWATLGNAPQVTPSAFAAPVSQAK